MTIEQSGGKPRFTHLSFSDDIENDRAELSNAIQDDFDSLLMYGGAKPEDIASDLWAFYWSNFIYGEMDGGGIDAFLFNAEGKHDFTVMQIIKNAKPCIDALGLPNLSLLLDLSLEFGEAHNVGDYFCGPDEYSSFLEKRLQPIERKYESQDEDKEFIPKLTNWGLGKSVLKFENF